jgi:hypothetical protein
MSCPCADCQRRRALRRREVDPVVAAVTRRFHERSAEGMQHYGVTMADNTASTRNGSLTRKRSSWMRSSTSSG